MGKKKYDFIFSQLININEITIQSKKNKKVYFKTYLLVFHFYLKDRISKIKSEKNLCHYF